MVSALTSARYSHPTYVVRQKVLKIFGNRFHIYDPSGNVAFYSKQKAFRLKEDIRLFTGEDMRDELLSMRARRIIDFGITFDVYDSTTGEKVGALRRKGFRSLLQDQWLILDQNDAEIGALQEDSIALALVRRLLLNLLPQTWHATIGGEEVAVYRQHFNPFVLKISIDFTPDPGRRLDRRMGIAIAVLLNAIEGRQE